MTCYNFHWVLCNFKGFEWRKANQKKHEEPFVKRSLHLAAAFSVSTNSQVRQHICDLGVNGGRAAPHGVCGRLLPSVAASLRFQTASGKAPWWPGGQEARSWIAATEETEIDRPE